MKRTLRLLALALIGAAGLGGCDRLLEEDPRGLLAPDQFFQQPAEAEQAVLGIYEHLLHDASYGRDFKLFGDWGVDLFHPARRIPSAFRWLLTYTMDTNSSQDIADNWRLYYRAVGDANLAISRISGMENIRPARQAALVGEAKFLRALYYWHLTNLWGDVPMWLDELNVEEVREMPRTPVAEVRAQIIKDLQDAEKALPSTYEPSGLGRATRWAAKALLAKVYLQMHDWQNARDKSLEIIQNSPHSLLGDHCDVFNHEDEFNSEIIFTVDFEESLGGVARANHGHRFTPRRQDERKAARLKGVHMGGFGWFTLYPQYAEQFTQRDARRKCSVATEIQGVALNWTYMPKWWDISSPRPDRGRNLIVFRLADLYLMHAEAENQLNGPAQAYPSINAIRKRAGLEPLSGLTKAQFQQALERERALELGSEGHRRWDLIRWGKLIPAVKSIQGFKLNPLAAENITQRNLLFPIPGEELTKNPNLTQNPGY